MKMRGVAAITAPWRQGYTAPEAAKQTSDAVHREICDDKETNDDAAEDRRVTERFLSFLFSFFYPTPLPQIQEGLFILVSNVVTVGLITQPSTVSSQYGLHLRI